jgi:uncharacterized protein
MPDFAIGLMAKYPEPGKVKTRLAEDIGNDEAYRIYLKLLCNAFKLCVDLDSNRFHRTIFVTPESKKSLFEENFSELENVYVQHGNDLGERMLNALTTLLNGRDVKSAILIGADIPDITVKLIDQAVTLLAQNDIVLGPTCDGGYYLIGMNVAHEELFHNFQWGTSEIFNQTIVICNSLNLMVGVLPKLRDLDVLEDLKFFEDYNE